MPLMESISTILFTGFCICLIHLLIGGFFIATCSYSGIFPMITIYLILLCWYSLQLRIHQYIKLIPNFAANFLVRVWYLPSDNNLIPLHPVWIENSSLLSCQAGCRNYNCLQEGTLSRTKWSHWTMNQCHWNGQFLFLVETWWFVHVLL